jgi:hypothetical protein
MIMTDEAKPDETEGTQQPESQVEPTEAEPTEQEGKKPKMCKLAILSILCIVTAFAVLAMYLFSSEASIPLELERLLMPAGVAILAFALIAGVIALVMIKASDGALGGRRFALLGIIIPIVAVVAFMRSKAPDEEPLVMPSTECMKNIRQLGADLLAYAEANDGKLPAAEKWCDVLGGHVKDESLFACPLAEGARCSYALNKYALEAGADLPEDVVLLFESKPGWNQVGGPELMITPHVSRRGNAGGVFFAGGRSRSIPEENVEELNWKPGQDTEEEDKEDEEPEEDEEAEDE